MLQYSNALRIDPANRDAYYDRGRMHYYVNRYQKAIDDFTKAIELKDWRYITDSETSDVYTRRANSHYLLSEHDLALSDYEKAIQIDPDNAWAWSSKANLYQWIGETSKSNADQKMACSLSEFYC